MTIGFDGNEANIKNRVGIGAYAYAIFTHMVRLLDEKTKLIVYLKDKPLDDLPFLSQRLEYQVVSPKRLWTQIGLPLRLFLQRQKPDVFFTPSHYAPRFSPVPVAVSIMDVSYLHFPETFTKRDLFQLKSWTSYSVKKAQAIFTISKVSKSDIIKQYGIDDKKIVVTYPGIRTITTLSPQIYTKKMIEQSFGIHGPYFLFVGTLQPRKNVAKLIEAFAILKKEKDISADLKLIIVGKKGWLYEDILAAPKTYNVEDSVKFLEFVKDEDLPILYKNAVAYVLPSLYEGFGLPILEAMAYGCPVITSNVSSLPEAGGDAALYVDPVDAEDMAQKMKVLLIHEKQRKELIGKGKHQVKKFSWEKTAEKTLEVLREVASNK